MATATKSKDKSKLKLQPLGDRIVVRREVSEGRTAGGIVLPDSAKDKPTRGEVIAVGNGRLLENGDRSTMQVKPGDCVLFTTYAGENTSIGDDEYILMGEGEVLAVIE